MLRTGVPAFGVLAGNETISCRMTLNMLTAQIHPPSRGAVTVVIRVAGELDMFTVPILRGAVSEALTGDATNLVLDVSGLTFCDARGMSAFVAARRRCVQRNGWLRLAGPSARLVRLLVLVGLDESLPWYADVAHARNAPVEP